MKAKTKSDINGAHKATLNTQLLHDVADLLQRVVPRSSHEAQTIEAYLGVVHGRSA